MNKPSKKVIKSDLTTEEAVEILEEMGIGVPGAMAQETLADPVGTEVDLHGDQQLDVVSSDVPNEMGDANQPVPSLGDGFEEIKQSNPDETGVDGLDHGQSPMRPFRAALDKAVDTASFDFLSQFASIRSPQALVELAERDPAAFARYQAKAMAVAHLKAEREALEAEERRHFAEAEAARLRSMHPELNEPTRYEEFMGRLRKYAALSGIQPELLSGAGARELSLLNKAMLWDEAQKVKEDALKRGKRTPTAQSPGTQVAQASGGLEAALARLKQTGRIEDAVSALELMNQ